MQFFYSATNGSDTGSVVAAVVGNEATANLSDLLPATTYTVYGVVTATNGSTPQSSSTTFTTEGARTNHAAWYELPARTTADETITQTVYPASGSQRNYTMYYDKSTYTAYWVAYPLAKGHMGNGRSDKWQRNPGLAESEQINVWSSSYGVNLGATTSDGYDSSKEFYARGHQIPNADRNGSDELVVQTYYATNSTPQIQNKFNGGIWQQLESGVRNIAATTDTVYVVTGAILQTAGNHEAITWITPKSDSKRCPVPNYYYKALLKVRRMPLLRALPPLAAGILLADHYVLPLWLLVGGFLVCGILALLADDRGANLATLGAILLFGMTVTELRHTPAPPTGTPGEYEIVVRERLSEREGKTASGTTIRARRNSATGEWLPAAGNLVVRCDSSTALNPGDRAVVRGKIYPFTARHGGYGRLMTRRGYVGTLYLNRSSLLLSDTLHRELSPKHLSLFLHERAVARLDRLALAPDEQALCNAMTAGDRRSLSPALRAAYSRSGTSHLLAVSGLHVGIVFLLANLLLWWLPLFRHGHILRNIAVILLIWLYAATTGFPPSVVRAALMFSVLQFALASSSEYVGMNTLAGVAFVMLLFHPDYLFDISFQLSFIAVAGIIAWGLPLCRLLRTRRKSIDMLTATLAIGFSASAATAPLISHTFGQISVVGLALNPVVILLSYVVVGSCTLWLVIPGTVLAPLFSVVAGFAARAQNELIRAAAALPAAALDIRLTTTQCWIVYGLFIFATLLLWSAERKKSVSSLPE
ncbi:ComEC/Rec2 family competence protein [Alistipes putredinis]|uniref:ComEC/Rec2 family competence protein n=2 Tax=Alistipes putredinis TaxID=28117 RepID=UPI003AAD0538